MFARRWLLPRLVATVSLFALLLAASCGVAQETWAARTPPDWAKPGEVSSRRIGVGIGGAMFPIAFHPSDPLTAYLGGDMGACLAKTTDGGKSWQMLGDNSVSALGQCDISSNITVCRSDPNVVWVGNQHGIFRSTDAGATWTLTTFGSREKLCRVAADPEDPEVATRVKCSLEVEPMQVAAWKTLDGGASWQQLCEGGEAIKWNSWPTGVFVDPTSEVVEGDGHQRLFAWVRDGIITSEDGGRTWAVLETDLPIGRAKYDRIYDLEPVVREGKLVLHALIGSDWLDAEHTKPTGGGVYRSNDGGRTWTPRNGGLEEGLAKRTGVSYQFHAALDFCESQPDVGYCYLHGGGGVYKTQDGGGTWSPVFHPNNTDVFLDPTGIGVEDWYPLQALDCGANVSGGYKPYLDGCRGLKVAPSDPDYVMITDNVTCFATHDGGGTWFDTGHEMGERFAPADRFEGYMPSRATHLLRPRGFHNVCAHMMAFDPFDPQTFVCCYDDLGLWYTRDGGEWYEWAYWGIVGRARTETRSAAFDPQVKGTLYAGAHDTSAGVYVLYVTRDGGRNFSRLPVPPLRNHVLAERKRRGIPDDGRLAVNVTDIVIDPASPTDARRLFIATNFGAYRSDDGGRSWTELSAAIGYPLDVRRLALDPAEPSRLYLGAIRFGREAEAYAGQGLFVCEDARAPQPQFTRLGEQALGGIVDVSVCRDHPNVVYAVAYDADLEKVISVWRSPRIWRSDDSGASWRRLETGEDHLPRGVLVNPIDPDRVYALCTMTVLNDVPVGLYRSTDGGESWLPICPQQTTSKTRSGCLAMDPAEPRRLLVYDFGSSFEVWDRTAANDG